MESTSKADVDASAEPWDLLNIDMIEERLFCLAENTQKLIINRNDNLKRLLEQKDNCYAEVRAFRDDLNKYLDKLEQSFFGELLSLECDQRKEIQAVVSELQYLDKTVKDLHKSKLKDLKTSLANEESNQMLELIKRSLTENESLLYSTLINKIGCQEVDLNMSLSPEIQTLTSRIRSLGEIYVARVPVDINFDEKKPVILDAEMEDGSGKNQVNSAVKTKNKDLLMYMISEDELNPWVVPKQEPIDEDFVPTEKRKKTEFSKTSDCSSSQRSTSHLAVMSANVSQINCAPTLQSPIIRTSTAQQPIAVQLTLVNNVPTLVPVLQQNQRVRLPFVSNPTAVRLQLAPAPSVSSPSVAGSHSTVPQSIVARPTSTFISFPNNNSISNTQTSTKQSGFVPILMKNPSAAPEEKVQIELQSSFKDKSQSAVEDTVVSNQLSDFQKKQREQQPSVDEVMSECQKNLSEKQEPSIGQPPALQPGKRFQRVSPEDLKELTDQNPHSKSTMTNTRWGVKMFQEWSQETTGSEVDFENISKEDLNEKLKYFYMETKPKGIESNVSTKKKKYHSVIYNKNTMKNVRAALNRHLKILNRDFDIVRDFTFRESNAILDTKMKLLAQKGLLPAKRIKEHIDIDDLKLISKYVYQPSFDPESLRFRVWYFIAIHFTSLGIDFHSQLTIKSFDFEIDKEGKQYIVMNPKTINHLQCGDLDKEYMYAKPEKGLCPVAALLLLIQKTSPEATTLFNRRIKEAGGSYTLSNIGTDMWYSSKTLSKRSYTGFMADLSKQAGCSKLYSANCLQKTIVIAKRDPELKSVLYC